MLRLKDEQSQKQSYVPICHFVFVENQGTVGKMPAEDEVSIEPTEGITFIGPFNLEKTVGLRLTNPTNHRIVYKMKSTRRQRFAMRPAYGFVEPNRRFCIKLACKPFPGIHLSSRDRFTILLAQAPDNSKGKRPSLVWKNLVLTIVRRHVLPVTYIAYVPEKVQEPRPKDDKIVGQVRPEQVEKKKIGQEEQQRRKERRQDASEEEKSEEAKKKPEKRRHEAEKENEETKKQDKRRQDAEKENEEAKKQDKRRQDAEKEKEEAKKQDKRRQDAEKGNEEAKKQEKRRQDAEKENEEAKKQDKRRQEAEKANEESKKKQGTRDKSTENSDSGDSDEDYSSDEDYLSDED